MARQEVVLRNPTATRPWQHVLEPLSGYILLGANLYDAPNGFAGSWNFGPPSSQCRTVGEVAEVIVNYFDSEGVVCDQITQHQHEAHLLQLNCDKAHQLLGWYPRWSVENTLRATATWYKSVLDGVNAKEVTASQIHAYFPELS
jgi:CDP-glucose 4,6-dehydratase